MCFVLGLWGSLPWQQGSEWAAESAGTLQALASRALSWLQESQGADDVEQKVPPSAAERDGLADAERERFRSPVPAPRLKQPGLGHVAQQLSPVERPCVAAESLESAAAEATVGAITGSSEPVAGQLLDLLGPLEEPPGLLEAPLKPTKAASILVVQKLSPAEGFLEG